MKKTLFFIVILLQPLLIQATDYFWTKPKKGLTTIVDDQDNFIKTIKTPKIKSKNIITFYLKIDGVRQHLEARPLSEKKVLRKRKKEPEEKFQMTLRKRRKKKEKTIVFEEENKESTPKITTEMALDPSSVTDEGLLGLFKIHEHLLKLEIQNATVTTFPFACAAANKYIPKLQGLNLSGSFRVSCGIIADLAFDRPIKYLNLIGCSEQTEGNLRRLLNNLKNPIQLSFGGISELATTEVLDDDKELEIIDNYNENPLEIFRENENLQSLTHLCIRPLPFLNSFDFLPIKHLKNLEVLDLSGTSVDDAVVRIVLPKLTKLRHLIISSNVLATETIALSALTELEIVQI